MKFLSVHTQTAERKAQRGFTLVSTVISMLIAGVVLTGAWLGYGDLQVQWRVANADRMMDQYAAATMQELTNTLSWTWGAKQIQGGRDQFWKFYLDDIVAEQPMSLTGWAQDFHIGPDHMLELSFRPTSGIFFNNRTAPLWASGRFNSEYIWSGRSGVPQGVLSTMDRRDRMTVEGLQLDLNQLRYITGSGVPNDLLKRSMVMTVELTMHYTYNAPTWFHVGTRMYGSRYVRERKYSTQIAMRNWDVETNEFRDKLLGLVNENG